MDLVKWLKGLILTKSEKPQPKARGFLMQPKVESAPQVPPSFIMVQPTQFTAPPAPPSPVVKPISFTVAKPPKPRVKVRILHTLSGVMILLNVVVGLFFVSNNMTLNAALLGYLGVSTILLGHYFSLTR